MSDQSGVSKFNAWFLPYAVDTLAEWRARHPLKVRVCEPLPLDEQTEQANQAALNLTPQQERERDALMYLLFGSEW